MRRKLLWAGVAGLLHGLAYPPFGLAPLAVFALAWVCVLSVNQRGWDRFWLGCVYGLVGWTCNLWWLFLVSQYNGLPVAGGVLLVLLILAAYSGFMLFAYGLAHAPLPRALWLAVTLTALEFLRGLGVLSFSWGNLGLVVWQWPFLLRLAGWVGVPGLTFLLALTAGALAGAWIARDRPRAAARALVPAALGWLVALGLCLALPPAAPSSTTPLRVAMVQGNHPQETKWEMPWREMWMDYAELTQTAVEDRPDLVIWPEVAVNQLYARGSTLASYVQVLAQDINVPLLAGLLYEGEDDHAFYNSAFLVRPATPTPDVTRYDKQHLVPFGEYTPYAELLPFVEQLVSSAGGLLAPGDSPVIMPLKHVALCPLICFESSVAQLVRRSLGREADVLVILTNDAWFEPGFGPQHHLIHAVFRAVENGVPVLHCANTGETALIDRDGRVLDRLPRRQAGVLTGQVLPGSRTGPPYRRWGDVFAWACMAAFAGGIALTRKRATASCRDKRQTQ